ncbi:MAG TPA: glucose-6-phosphate dehydrogenase assembly protein OpcA [Methylomirabilota bacterium]|nr:glucose-6-phosphate dehydrogenase assembly protein OpcA [Methylomirabilota bacterium]
MEDPLTSAAVVARGPEAVGLRAVEQELGRPWSSPDALAGAPSARALMGNLVIVCRREEEKADVEEELATIVSQYPSRVLLLVADAGSQSAEIDASVTVYRRAGEASQPACGECVTIRAGSHAIARLPSAVRALLLGDLPTTLWWVTPEAPPLAGELFVQLAELAGQVIYDSFAWTDPLRQLVVVANWVGGGRQPVTSDLAWRRPKLWHRIIAQSLDPGLAPGAFEAISAVAVEHGPHALTQAWLLAGWLGFRLGWVPRGGKVLPGPEVSWAFQSAQGAPRVEIRRLATGATDVQSVRVVTKVNGRPVTFRFTREGPGQVTVFAEGLADRTLGLAGPVQSRAALVARQLPDLARDRLFESSLALARTMAETVL